jgi:hypothetical protein
LPVTAALHSIECRCQTRAVVAARNLGGMTADHGVALAREPIRPAEPT